MGKPGSLTLKEKYELLKKKQAERAITKKEPSGEPLSANQQLVELIAKKNQEEAERAASKPAKTFKLPTRMQRALNKDPAVLQRETPIASEEESNETKTKRPRRRFDDDDKDFFVKRENCNAPVPVSERNRYGNDHPSNRTYTDAEGIEYFTCTVFVGDISSVAEEYHLEEAFHSYGQIISARIINDKPYGFVKFKYEEDARRAIAEMNGHLLCGTPIRVSSAKVPNHNKPHYRRNYAAGNPRNSLDNLPDRDNSLRSSNSILHEEEENYGHLGSDDLISERSLVTYDDI